MTRINKSRQDVDKNTTDMSSRSDRRDILMEPTDKESYTHDHLKATFPPNNLVSKFNF